MQDIARFDIVIGNTNLTSLRNLAQLAEHRPASVKWVSLIEGSAFDYVHPMPYLLRTLRASDLVNAINRHSLDLFRAMTSAPVEYIGIPYPAAQVRALATPIERRRREVFLCPILGSRWSEMFVARKLGLPYHGCELRLTRRLKTVPGAIRKYKTIAPEYFWKKIRRTYEMPDIDIRGIRRPEDHLREGGQALLWLNFDERYTWGRNVLDAAALGVPVIATRSTGHAQDFFPQLMLETPFDLEKAFQLAARLVTDEAFYRDSVAIPLERIEHLEQSVMVKKLLDVLPA